MSGKLCFAVGGGFARRAASRPPRSNTASASAFPSPQLGNEEKSEIGEALRSRSFRHAEVDDLRHGRAVGQGDENVRGLEVAVDDPFLMRVLHRVADGDEELEPVRGRQVVLVAILRDANPAH